MSTNVSDLNRLEAQLKTVKEASYITAALPADVRQRLLITFADRLMANKDTLLAANAKDLAQAQTDDLTPALAQRLKLDDAKLTQLCQGIKEVAALEDPLGKVLHTTQLDDGLVLQKINVPLGVVAIIFESRPDVLPQVLSLLLKTGNCGVFKGGREALHTNRALMDVINSLSDTGELPSGWVCLLESREDAQAMLDYPKYLDLVVPRGSNQLVQSIMAKSQVPVLGHADGICHIYVHPSADVEKAIPLIVDAKTQYPAACNALETLLVDAAIADTFLLQFAAAAHAANIPMFGDEATQQRIPGAQPATEDSWHTEYGDNRLSVKVVDGLEAAIAHINTYGSHHTDALLVDPDQKEIQQRFLAAIDSANVYINASTRFADGFRYGFGAEVGISTSKTHARGPVGIDGLLSTQYRLEGQYHTVAPYTGKDAKAFQHRKL